MSVNSIDQDPEIEPGFIEQYGDKHPITAFALLTIVGAGMLVSIISQQEIIPTAYVGIGMAILLPFGAGSYYYLSSDGVKEEKTENIVIGILKVCLVVAATLGSLWIGHTLGGNMATGGASPMSFIPLFGASCIASFGGLGLVRYIGNKYVGAREGDKAGDAIGRFINMISPIIVIGFIWSFWNLVTVGADSRPIIFSPGLVVAEVFTAGLGALFAVKIWQMILTKRYTYEINTEVKQNKQTLAESQKLDEEQLEADIDHQLAMKKQHEEQKQDAIDAQAPAPVMDDMD